MTKRNAFPAALALGLILAAPALADSSFRGDGCQAVRYTDAVVGDSLGAVVYGNTSSICQLVIDDSSDAKTILAKAQRTAVELFELHAFALDENAPVREAFWLGEFGDLVSAGYTRDQIHEVARRRDEYYSTWPRLAELAEGFTAYCAALPPSGHEAVRERLRARLSAYQAWEQTQLDSWWRAVCPDSPGR
jgi:hypothetical protein